jgi:ATP-dependent DNA helicase RecG
VGARRVVSGPLSRFGDAWQIIHPELISTAERFVALGARQPVYPLCAGVSQGLLWRVIGAALDALPEVAEWQDPGRLRRQGWPGFAEALRRLHRPADAADLLPGSPCRRRLAYDELLASQLALGLVRRQSTDRPAGRSTRGTGRLRQAVLSALPFRLTAAQRAALAELDADLARPEPKLRLLQGDVGSGKTIVALAAMLSALEAGGQAARMAPTEVLARQHARTLATLLAPVGLAPALLTGRERGALRARLCDALASGSARIAVGTHALFQDDVRFADLALAVVRRPWVRRPP